MSMLLKAVGAFWIAVAVFALLYTTKGWGFAIEGVSDILAIGFLLLGIVVVLKG